MCPLYPINLLCTYTFLTIIAWLIAGSSVLGAVSRSVSLLQPRLKLNSSIISSLNLKEEELQHITFYLDDVPEDYVGELLLQISSSDGLEHLKITPSRFAVNNNVTSLNKPPDFPTDAMLKDGGVHEDNKETGKQNGGQSLTAGGRYMKGEFDVSGVFLGFSKVRFVLSDGTEDEQFKEIPEDTVQDWDESTGNNFDYIPAKVQRGKHMIDKVFIHAIVLLVVILYINMGCAIDIDVIKATLRRPVAPVIGLLAQYLVMPLLGYGLGYLFLSETPSLWLGLFVTGCAPGGGGSNMWTYLLGGSLDLSVTMTFVSTLAAFALMPMWLWALAPTIFQDGQFDSPPYRNIAMLVLGLIVPISLGLALKRCCPKGAAILKKLLKPLSLFFLVFAMVFGSYAYWFIFKFFTWRVAVCGLAMPLFGFTAGGVAALLFKRNPTEALTISIETGLQNTGLAIGLLKVALLSFSPLGDIAMVVPIAVATFTPLPLTVAYGVMLWRNRGTGIYKTQQQQKQQINAGDETSVTSSTLTTA